MSPAVHFTISLLIALCLGIKTSRKAATVLLLAFIGMAPDLDHFLPTINGASLFHNTLFLGVVPLFLLIFIHLVETNKDGDTSFYQRFLIGVTVILMGHLILDLIDGNVIQLGFFANSVSLSIPDSALLENSTQGVIFSIRDLLWMALAALVLLGRMSTDKVYSLYEDWVTLESRLFEKASLDGHIPDAVKDA